MYGSEAPWEGQRSMERRFQRSINRMARASLGVLPSTPLPSYRQREGHYLLQRDWPRDRELSPFDWPQLPEALTQG